jgi:hypothetical protein
MLGDNSMLDEGQLERESVVLSGFQSPLLILGCSVPDEELALVQDDIPSDGPSQSSLPGNVNVNERQFLEYAWCIHIAAPLQAADSCRFPW